MTLRPGSVTVSRDWRGGLTLALRLSEPLPYALQLADDPPRLLLRLDGALAPVPAEALPEGVTLYPSQTGAVLSLPLAEPRLLQRAEMTAVDDAGSEVELTARLRRADAESFAAAVAQGAAVAPPLPPGAGPGAGAAGDAGSWTWRL